MGGVVIFSQFLHPELLHWHFTRPSTHSHAYPDLSAALFTSVHVPNLISEFPLIRGSGDGRNMKVGTGKKLGAKLPRTAKLCWYTHIAAASAKFVKDIAITREGGNPTGRPCPAFSVIFPGSLIRSTEEEEKETN